MKGKISASSSLEDVNDDVKSEDLIETNSDRSTPQRLDPLPMKAKRAAREQLLRAMETREKQSMAFRTKVLEMVAPSKSTERTTYADWAKEVMVSLHPSLWFKFRWECTNLLYTSYQDKSEELFQLFYLLTIRHFSRYASMITQSIPVLRSPALLPIRCGSDLPYSGLLSNRTCLNGGHSMLSGLRDKWRNFFP